MLENAATFAQGARSSWKRGDPTVVDSRFRGNDERGGGNDGYVVRLPFAVAEISHRLAEGFAGILDCCAVLGQLREKPGEDEGGEG